MKDRLTVKCCGKYITYKGVTHNQCKQRLGEYEEAEENGLLLRLPCKVGDKAYVIVNKNRVYEMEVMGIYPFGAFYEDEEKEISRIYNLYLDGNVYYKHCTFYDIGKTVFLTKEEAEKVLEEMQKTDI